MSRLRSQLDQMLQQQAASKQGSLAQPHNVGASAPVAAPYASHPYDEIQLQLDALGNQTPRNQNGYTAPHQPHPAPVAPAQPVNAHIPQTGMQYQPQQFAPQPVAQHQTGDVSNIKESIDRLMGRVQAVAAAQQQQQAQSMQAQNLQAQTSQIRGQVQPNPAISNEFLLEIRNEFAHLQGEMTGLKAQLSGMPTTQMPVTELASLAAGIQVLQEAQAAQPAVLNQIVGELESLRQSFSSLAPNGETENHNQKILAALDTNFSAFGQHLDTVIQDRGDLDGLTKTIKSSYADLASRLDMLQEQSPEERLAGISDHVASINSALENLPKSMSLPQMQKQLQSIAKTVDILADDGGKSVQNSFSSVETRLDEITRGLVALSVGGPSLENNDELERIEARISSLSNTLENFVENAGQTQPAMAVTEASPQLMSTLSQIEERLSAIEPSVSANIQDNSAQVREALQQIESKLYDLDQNATQHESSDQFSALASQLTRISEKVDDVFTVGTIFNNNEGDSTEALQAQDVKFEYVLTRLDTVLEGLEKPRPLNVPQVDLSSIEKQLSDLADQMGERASASAVADNSLEVLSELQKLSKRIEEFDQPTSAEFDESPRLKSLEEQLEIIVGKLGGNPLAETDLSPIQSQLDGIQSLLVSGTSTTEDDIAGRLENIERSIAASRDITIEVASQAAQDAVSEVSEKYSASIAGGEGVVANPAIDNEVLTTLASDIRALHEVSAENNQSNSQSLQALGETLTGIVSRLSNMELQFAAQEPANVAASMPMPTQGSGGQPAFEQQIAVHGETPRPVHIEDALAKVGEQLNQVETAWDDGVTQPATVHADQIHANNPAQYSPSVEVDAPSLDMGELPEVGEPQTPYSVDPAEPIDASTNAASLGSFSQVEVVEDAPLEPGTSGPEIAALVRQTNKKPPQTQDESQTNAGGTDFLAAARRAAQAAANEVSDLGQEVEKAPKESFISSIPDFFAKKKKIVLLAAAAVLVVALAAPLATRFMGGGSVFVTDPQKAAVEAPMQKSEMPAETKVGDGAAIDPEVVVAPLAENLESEKPTMADGSQPSGAAGEQPMAKEITTLQEPEVMTPKASETSEKMAGQELTKAPLPEEAVGNVVLRQEAANGNPMAQFEIARRYDDGRGVKADLAAAADWYQRAAAGNYAPAQYRAGIVFQRGYGVQRDPNKAAIWYQQAAEKGHVSAMHNLAVLHASGAIGGGADYAAAAKWFEKAANFGMADSQVNLGILYTQGEGVKTDLKQAYKWFAIAAQTGDSDATSKRDKIGNALRSDQSNEARAEVSLWRPQAIDKAVNSFAVPQEWIGTPASEASVGGQDKVAVAQQKLSDLGFDPGPADGLMGKKTKLAIMQFQERAGLKTDGEVSDELISRLKSSI